MTDLRVTPTPTATCRQATEVGTVTLVGAGPGGSDLITVRGALALAVADVVVYDRLADPELLELAPVRALLIAVGKARGVGAHQDDINAVLSEHARAGANVVRLKGGDPFVFGRGSEEIDALTAEGIHCEVIPGISSALAAPALAGIPLTERGAAASFTVLTGHRIDDADHDWSALAGSSSTLVVLMGSSTSSMIAARLLEGGRPEREPVAVVHAAGTPQMRTASIDLSELRSSGCPFPAPCVIVIGDVAARVRPIG
ncbi:MAG: uroporphyrinogen-III C-methyltransferase [Ilumatobacter sp.]|uniref:uroporphyrinogen-III C-methyltransferase n=1 Tax=Ilumatobacter sp. TaxID=1967498 RepID=UPI003C753795